jgi:hypothetical protein
MNSWNIFLAALTGRLVQRLVIFGIIVTILYMVGEQFLVWYQWTVLVLVILLEWAAYQQGVVEGVQAYAALSQAQQNQVRRLIMEIEQGVNNNNDNDDNDKNNDQR